MLILYPGELYRLLGASSYIFVFMYLYLLCKYAQYNIVEAGKAVAEM
jgi:hypothetical protein